MVRTHRAPRARAVSLGEGAPRDRGDLLDGRALVSPAALRLPLRRARRQPAVGDLQGDGAEALPAHHAPGDARDDRVRIRAGLAPGDPWISALGGRLALGEARARGGPAREPLRDAPLA